MANKVTLLPDKKVAIVYPGDVRPALCLDLDGTVREEPDKSVTPWKYINKLLPNAEEKIWQYRSEGYLIFGISNQGGVAFGLKTPMDNDAELDAMLALFKSGNPFHLIKVCYHHEGGNFEPYNHRSLLRKPSTGMLALCEVEAYGAGFIVDWDNSLFVGDRPEDEECAKNAGIEFRWANEFFERDK